MIPRPIWAVLVFGPLYSAAATEAPLKNDEVQDTPQTPMPFEEFRMPFETLLGRSIGQTSRAVRFDWRRSTLGVAAHGSQLSELNTFRSGRFGLSLRTPVGDLMGELGLSYVQTRSTNSSRALAQTPFRQAGRPSRLELDLSASFPLAEGVVTALPAFVPPMEMVFSVTGSWRYAYYRGSQAGFGFGRRLGTLFRPALTDEELQNLEARRLGGMEIDRSRMALMVGFSNDIYFSSGVFVTPRAMLNVPLGALTDTNLGFWWEIGLSAGWAF